MCTFSFKDEGRTFGLRAILVVKAKNGNLECMLMFFLYQEVINIGLVQLFSLVSVKKYG